MLMITSSPVISASPVVNGNPPGEPRIIARSLLTLLPYRVAVEAIAIPWGIDAAGRIEVAIAAIGDHKALQLVQIHIG